MRYDQDLKGQKEDFDEKLPPMSKHSSYAEMTPSPSYHTFDGIWKDQAARPGTSFGPESHNRAPHRSMIPQHHTLRDEDPRVNQRSRDDRRKHQRPRRSSSSHSGIWTAKVVLQGLKTNLFGSNNTDRSTRGTREQKHASRTTKLGISNTTRDVHYTINNHWHDISPSEDIFRAKTWPDCEQTRHGLPPFVDGMIGTLPNFGYNSHPTSHINAGRAWGQGNFTSLDDRVPGVSQRMYEEMQPNLVWGKLFGDFNQYLPNERPCAHSGKGTWWSSHQGNPQRVKDDAHEWRKHCPDFVSEPSPTSGMPSDQHSQEAESLPPNSKPCPCQPPKPAESMPDAASALANYNKHWDYIDGVQVPYPHELPWPTIRPNLSFDHMKCDVFFFFALACGLQPDRTKAPKLDFKLFPRSLYPSYDQRQQQSEREMLRSFKQQMQREKLRWHEDKLRRKFPNVIGAGSERDDEKRKAVWAAIAEGSAVCDKRLGNML